MSLSAHLWSDNADVASEILAHPFVRGIADGTLPRARFATYIAQDAFFLESFARAYALALARSPDTATLLALADLITGVREELALHASYAESWGIDMAGVEPLDATSAYTEFLLATAGTQDVGVIYAAMTPCMRLYAWLGQSIDPDRAGPYAQWVQTYADPEFEKIARVLEGLLDDQAAASPAVRRAYRRAMHLELAFFDAA
ncbi:thiaminase/transcriptional activator TenA [Mycobacterium sp. BK086]|uniref:TenA family protein n=1 Tax=Mycobacterium sp. BK086 TaxID=2512165 RepID=UPI00105C7440|nr:TenA family protein [Mycobacterium sp. BK086]TDO14874.1 thiaminase/transcriptional activator TenA [Mycobacterium sp. BK086]